MRTKDYYVYIMANQKPVLYIGVTNDLARRISQHRQQINSGFTSEYGTDKLVYYEIASSIESAISREKQLKRWHREWKLNLVAEANPKFEDLSSRVLGRP